MDYAGKLAGGLGQINDLGNLKQYTQNAKEQRTVQDQLDEVSKRLAEIAGGIGNLGDRLYGPEPTGINSKDAKSSGRNVTAALIDIFEALNAAEYSLRRVSNGL